MKSITKFLKISTGTALLSLGLFASAPALADDCEYAMTQADMNQCMSAQTASADRQLNSTYQRLQGMLNKSEKNQLKLAERAWIAHRDQSCKFANRKYVGGSSYAMSLSGCILKETKQRTGELQDEIDSIQN